MFYTGAMALRGVNLGGWLVAERWMTPELFRDVKADGEIALVRELGMEMAKKRLKKHRDEFITEQDITWIKKQGFDFVRIPVGYWLFEQTDDFIDGEAYLQHAFRWATKYKLGVVLDFHGLQGSQNGYDHSGQPGRVRLYRRNNKAAALKTLEYMCQRYGQQPSLLGIEVINEPKVRWCLGRLMSYYTQAYRIVARNSRGNVRIIVSDAFKPLRVARKLSRLGLGGRLVVDIHLYQVFSHHDIQLNLDGHIEKIQRDWNSLLTELKRYTDVMVGEWSAALPTQSYQGLPGGEAENAVHYYNVQRQVFHEHAWAECYWSYKAPGCGVWDYRSQLDFQQA